MRSSHSNPQGAKAMRLPPQPAPKGEPRPGGHGLSEIGAAVASRQTAPPSAELLIPVCVISADAAVRDRLTAIIECDPSLLLAGSFSTPEAAEGALAGHRRCVAVVHEGEPARAATLASMLKSLAATAAAVIYTGLMDAAAIFSALSPGADGCVFDTAPPEQVVQAISEAAQGRPFLCPQARWQILVRLRLVAAQRGAELLTAREEDVCVWLAFRTEKDAAWGLNITSETVHRHAKAAYKKLGIHGRHDLIRLLRAAG